MDKSYAIELPEGYDERDEAETPVKGWLVVVVRFASGYSYEVSFYDPVRLLQTANDVLATDEYYTDPNLVVLREVNTVNITNAIADLVARGFFDKAVPSA
ncbi:hypothetical protein AB0L57_03240 [Nocardia sp. NPDC052254]|uniref:hypothetical protein n=1 Tax=Nocardia sp. NPDC052254 TaxID=3155681 RepID=UPI00341F4331